MANRITWRPTVDAMNCDCVIVFDQLHSEAGVLISETLVEVKRKCAAHADVPDNELMGVIKDNPDAECHIKAAIESSLVTFPEFGQDVLTTGEGGLQATTREFKPDVLVKVIFTGVGKQRKVGVIASPDLKASQKTAVRAAVLAKLGLKAQGRVEL